MAARTHLLLVLQVGRADFVQFGLEGRHCDCGGSLAMFRGLWKKNGCRVEEGCFLHGRVTDLEYMSEGV